MPLYFWISTSSGDPTNGANWMKSDGTTGAAPANGDDVVLAGVPGLALANIAPADQSAVTLNSLTVRASFSGQVGSASTSSTSFFGYWKIGATTWTIDGKGSSRLKFNGGAAASTVTVLSSGPSADAGLEAVRWVGSNAANKFYVTGGTAGVGTNLPGEAATLAEVDVAGSQATLNLGPAVAWTTANVSAGAVLSAPGGGTTLSVSAGSSATLSGSAAVTTVNNAGAVSLNNRPACSTLNAHPGSTTDFSGNPAAATVSAANLYPGARVTRFPANPGHVTFSTLTLVNCGNLAAS